MSKVFIKDIAEVISGYSFRKTLEDKKGDSIFVLQAKNISDDGTVNENDLDGINFENSRSKAIVQKGDVIISSRGYFKAGVVIFAIKNIIATSSVYILRLKSSDILPQYLAIFLNSQNGQKQLKKNTTGVVINSILRKDLEEIEIPFPDIPTQEKIVKIYYTNNKLQKMLQRKMHLITSINEEAINKLLI